MDVTFASIVGAGLLLIALFVLALIVAKFYRRVEQGKALIVGKKKGPDVTFTGAVVLPIIHKAEVMDISVKTIEIDRRGKEGLICRDNIRADIKVTFFVRVNKTIEDVIKVAQSIGCIRASDRQTLEELFSAKFSEGLKTIGKQLDFVDLYTKRNEFRDAIIELIGRDLNGYVLEDAAIDYLEQTPVTSLDPKNILDAQGIRKITELTAAQHVQTNQFENTEKKQIRKQDVEAGEAILELDRQYADAESKQQREIESVRAREAAELAKIQAEERLRAEHARIRTDEELAVAEENMRRQVEVAGKNRERVVAVESERVTKDQSLEAVSRERAVELSRIEKEKALEVERKNIQDVIRERVAVERTVVEEEERIKSVKVVEDARRNREAVVIAAEAEAQEKLVKQVKEAEGGELAARHQAKERITLAEAELESADRVARAKIRLAEGIQAEQAAAGLADVKVKEADAIATEKFGTAEASVHLQKALADAEGITKKAEALKELDAASRDHEEFRLRIENERLLGIESIKARQAVEEAKAEILGAALTTANIDIVGGDGAFVDRLVNSIGMGKAVDEFLSRSDNAAALAAKLTDGLLPVKEREPEVVRPKLPVKQTTAD
ncbi:MAG TPA: flotillin family protein [Thermoanaerobaculia bacterium]|nr:flotillin family protein [Thermoanaerobaculia bacterium]